jgi:hypothetical protein
MADPRCGVRERYGQGRQEVEIDVSLAQPLTAPMATNEPNNSRSENVRTRRSARDQAGMDSGQPGE